MRLNCFSDSIISSAALCCCRAYSSCATLVCTSWLEGPAYQSALRTLYTTQKHTAYVRPFCELDFSSFISILWKMLNRARSHHIGRRQGAAEPSTGAYFFVCED